MNDEQASGLNGIAQENDGKTHVLIAGAGLTGLILAHGLRKLNQKLEAQGFPPKYSCTVYERDASQMVRGGGFSLTIHWALEHLEEILPDDMASRIYQCVGNPAALEAGDMGSFTYLNLSTGEPLIRVPVPQGWKGARMARVKFIDLLMEGLDIHFSKRLADITFPDSDTVCAEFEDGEKAVGNLLIGADGSRSVVRRFLYGEENSKNRQLPIRMINARVTYPMGQLKTSYDIDPHLFHGGDPEQNGYWMYALLDMPPRDQPNGPASVQLTISWPFERGYLGEKEGTDPPESFDEKRDLLKRISRNWASPVRDLLHNIPDDSVLRAVNIEEWLPSNERERKTDQRVAVVGDAAHLMTSFRGENANHGVVDVCNLLRLLGESGAGKIDIKDVVSKYEEEMISRTRPATVNARNACLDANHYANVKPGSMFLARRSMYS
ncbi:hypothetical protein M409DRAFT_49163 [Zasmidium cellare ATCC 36951]|uniref:FAD-binding domain-containing protein n=1 Tax=Zasmidium cellare ATCC 36951 TaxID=1080233 RepID=A0A6A6D2G2_ZASCE|nr:uncharacterized protein M409DRAFT_49163 [Zasmidium cellare ATCC 36951]KAF2172608.1 hypothetical protein M409DRAFT_49163 [Zasmidium cellare ATCC 36951]